MADERYHVLARKWRPAAFAEVVGQDHVSRSLANALKHGKIHHAYLFCGPRGIGKTTVARILAKTLNCVEGPTDTPCLTCPACVAISDGSSMDVMEIDGASNNSVDQVRDLRETLGYSPAESRYRVIIIDEVHMLSKAAFNALLKTLEEPPPHVVFIFATTEAIKVLPTVQSRCQRYDFRRLTVPQIRGQLQKVSEAEGVDVAPGGLDLIARRADGAMRDGESLLDQVTAAVEGHISAEQVADLIGAVEREVYLSLMNAVADGNAAETLACVGGVVQRGRSLTEFLAGLMLHLRHLLACSVGANDALTEVDESERADLSEQAKLFGERDLVRMLNLAAETESQLNTSAAPQVRVELAALKMAYLEKSVDLADLVGRIEDLAGPSGDHVAERQPPTPRARGPAPRSGESGAPADPSAAPEEPEPQQFATDANSSEAEPPSAPPDVEVHAPDPHRPVSPEDAPRPRGQSGIAVIKARWPEITDVLKDSGVPSWIDTQARPTEFVDGTLTVGLKDAFHTQRFRAVERDVLRVVQDRFPDVLKLSIVEMTEAPVDELEPSARRPGASVVQGVVQDEPIIGQLIGELDLDLIE